MEVGLLPHAGYFCLTHLRRWHCASSGVISREPPFNELWYAKWWGFCWFLYHRSMNMSWHILPLSEKWHLMWFGYCSQPYCDSDKISINCSALIKRDCSYEHCHLFHRIIDGMCIILDVSAAQMTIFLPPLAPGSTWWRGTWPQLILRMTWPRFSIWTPQRAQTSTSSGKWHREWEVIGGVRFLFI